MSTSAKPYPLGKAIAVGLALAVGFLLLSLGFLFLQARSTQVRLAGEVIAVADDSITIRSARGNETVLILNPDAKLRGLASVAAIADGQHIMIRGNFTETNVFEVDGLRVVKNLNQR